MPNPLDYVTLADIRNLGLTPEDLATAYQPSSGGVYHCRGPEGVAKTLFEAPEIFIASCPVPSVV